MNLIDVMVVIQILVGYPIGVYLFAGKKITYDGTADMLDRYKWHFLLIVAIYLMKSAVFLLEEPVEQLFAIDFTPMIYEFEGNSIFWVQHYLEHPAMTLLMGIVYIGSFLFIMVFTIILFAYMNMKRVASRLIYLYIVLFILTVPFYLLVVVYTPSYPKMFYPGAASMISGMEPLLYNYGPRVNEFFVNYDTFNNCFPSMHIGYPSAIIMMLFMDVKGFRRYKAFLLIMLALISVSILYLGIHWISDILGGFLIAVVGVIIADRYAARFWKHMSRFDRWAKDLVKKSA